MEGHSDRARQVGRWLGLRVQRVGGRLRVTVDHWRTMVMALAVVLCAVVGVTSLAYATADDGGAAPPGPQADQAGQIGPPAKQLTEPVTPTTVGPGSRHRQRPSPGPGKRVEGPPRLHRAVPVWVAIPSVGIRTDLLRLGLYPDGTLQMPWKPLLAGWYSHSPTPGQLGPAIIVGHVDSWETGPAVFYRLGDVQLGARVRVDREDGSVAIFRVDAVRSYPKNEFPTQLVYGDTERSELRLITCGTWNSSTQHYDNNVIVFSHLMAAASKRMTALLASTQVAAEVARELAEA